MSRSLLAPLWFALLSVAPAIAQTAVDPDEQRELVAGAIRLWVRDYEAGRLGPAGVLRGEGGLQPAYVQKAAAAGFVCDHDRDRLRHVDLLEKLLYFAEKNPSEEVGDAVLEVAAAGVDRSLADRTAVQVRDAGHWTLMRTEHQGTWFLLMRAAAGDQIPLLADKRREATRSVAVQVAALRLLGMRNLPVFRSTIEGALLHVDARVRLAAVEALEFQRRIESLPIVHRALSAERHPVVSQALVRTLLALLKAHAAAMHPADRERVLRGAVRLLGQCGWRTDMDLVALVEEFPAKAAIPDLIAVLERARETPDALVDAVNKNASPLLRERAHGVLRAMTGALLPAGEPHEWRKFWATEQDRIEVPARLVRTPAAGATRAKFFGVPVVGRSIAFLVDTSGSMDQAASGTVGDGGRGRRSAEQPSRLQAAKDQLLCAVQAMDAASRYHVLTFAGDAQRWSRKPVPPTAESIRSLTELLSRFRAEGGTNLYDGLVQALGLDQQRMLGNGPEQHDEDVDELFVLTDGEPTAGEVREPDRLLEMVREANKYRKIRINAVFTGRGPGAGFLRQLAEQNDGVFVQR